MRRYNTLIKTSLNDMTIRQLSQATKVPVTCLSDYIHLDSEPRLSALQKLSRYYDEPISSLLSEDDEFTAKLLQTIRELPQEKKKELLDWLRS